MNNVRVISLYSGSKGNATVISSPAGTILIDAGKNAKQLNMALKEAGISPDSIGAILLTHEHNDHVSALSVFLKKHPVPVHLPVGCVYKLEGDPAIHPCLCPHPPRYTETICGLLVTSFATSHDSRASVGYRIEIPTESGVITLGYATDVGYVSREVEEALLGCDAVVLESNHDEDMLMNGPYPYDLKLRVASKKGHLSNYDSSLLATRLCASGTRSLLLAHLSEENNTPDTALDACISTVADASVRVAVASQDQITPLEILL